MKDSLIEMINDRVSIALDVVNTVEAALLIYHTLPVLVDQGISYIRERLPECAKV